MAIGLLLCSQSNSYAAWLLGFGVLAGAGIGFGYSAATPPALKWFPPAKTGLIAGLVVAGFGLASVYIAPLSEYLLKTMGINNSMMLFGVAFLVVVCGLSLLLVNPPQGYVPEAATQNKKGAVKKSALSVDATPAQMMKSANFYVLWFIYFIGAGVGLMVISSIAGMAKKSMPNCSIPGSGHHGGGQCRRPHYSRHIIRQNRQKLYDADDASVPGSAYACRHPAGRSRAPERSPDAIAGNVYRIQLWIKPVPVSVSHQGSVGAQVVRH